MAVLAALESVDAVTWFDEDTPAALIAACRPEVLVKGGDWPVEHIVGASELLARGGAVHSIPFEHQRSTTALLRRVGAVARAATRKKAPRASVAASKRRGERSRARRKGR